MKSPQSTRIRIVNPVTGGSAFTSPRKAELYVEVRGRAVWTDGRKTEIRYLDDAEIVLNRQVRSEMQKDEEYWGAVAKQRGGTADRLHYIIRKSATRPTMPGGPEGAAIMTFIPVIMK